MHWSELIHWVLGLAFVIFLILFNGFFVAAEFAIVKIRETQLIPLIRKGHRRAKLAHRIIHHLDASLSATQLGITIASLGLGWFGEPFFSRLLIHPLDWVGIQSTEVRHSIAFAVGFTLITFLDIVVGELAPKSIAIQKPLATAIWVAFPLRAFYRVTYPFIWLLNHTAQALLRQIGIEPATEAEKVHSEEEFRLMVASSPSLTGVAAASRELVLNALDLRRRIVAEVMRPRKEIVAFNTKNSLAECLAIAEKSRYSRFPLCEEGDLDKTLGAVHFKDLFAWRLRAKSAADLIAVARKLIYVPETARLEKLLQLFLERKVHFAIVVDEYGATVGMITLENILEELVGPIQDEFDQEKPLLVKTGEESWKLEGFLPLHEFSELVGRDVAEEDITTIGGWVTHQLGGFPKPGDTVRVGEYQLRVVAMDGMRVAQLELTRSPETP